MIRRVSTPLARQTEVGTGSIIVLRSSSVSPRAHDETTRPLKT